MRIEITGILSKMGVLRPSKIMYIGGSDVLPPPLKGADEQRMLELLSRGDAQAKQILIEHNLRLVVYIARRFENSLIKAVGTFRTDKKIKLATYASRCIENEILMHIRKISSQKAEVSLDEPINTDWDGNELLLSDILGTEADTVIRPMEEHEERTALHEALELLSPRERRIICWRYGLCGQRERTQKEVADLLGISQSYISRLEKRIMIRLRREMTRQWSA